MTSRQRLHDTINHKQPGKVVVDLGSSMVTGISAVALTNLRLALKLEDKLVHCNDTYMFLGDVEEDVRKALGIDVVKIGGPYAPHGYKNENYKPFTMPCGCDVLIGGGCEYDRLDDGSLLIYPGGDRSVPPSSRMPADGSFADCIVRQGNIDDENLHARQDYASDFKPFSEEVLGYITDRVNYYYDNTDYGMQMAAAICSLGDAGALPAPGLKVTKGIRSLEDWLVAHYTNPDYIKEVYAFQEEVAMQKLKALKAAVGDRIEVVQISATDFGTQKGEFISPSMFCEFYKPIYGRINEWVHNNTNWKVFYHSCGSIVNLLDHFVEIGVDIINPVQCSAAGMDPKMLKEKYGDKLTFWGGGVDTQRTLPFGTPEEVYEEVSERLKIFAPGGGFVFNPVHNVLANTPPENLLAVFKAISDYNR